MCAHDQEGREPGRHPVQECAGRFFCLEQVHESSGGKEVSVLATVTLKDGESQESLLKRFRKEVMQERILSEARRKRWYISPSEMRRIQKQRAIRRARRRQRQREARQKYS